MDNVTSVSVMDCCGAGGFARRTFPVYLRAWHRVRHAFGVLPIVAAICLCAHGAAKAGTAPALPPAAREIAVPMPLQREAQDETRLSSPDGESDRAEKERKFAEKFSRAAEKTYRQYPNQITLHILNSPQGLDWSNATAVFKSYTANVMAGSHAVGHVAFEISCVSDSGRKTIVTGQTDGENNKEYLYMWWHNKGYNVFFGYVPGAMQTREQVEAEFGDVSGEKGRTAFATFLVSPQSCAEAARFVETYKSEKVYARFGINQRPLHKEGACCANLAAAVLRVAGVTDHDKDWSRTFYVPLSLVDMTLPREPSIIDELGLYDWTVKPSEAYRVLHFFDPDLFHRWTTSNRSAKQVNGHATGGYKIGRAPGLVLDYRGSVPTSWWLSD
ncbi:MAG: hypothetical protein WC421_02985 [Elusimicrobiales bacterium]